MDNLCIYVPPCTSTFCLQGGVMVYTCAELEAATDGFDAAKKIGQGGFGKVYRAMLRRTDVAIKVLHEVSNSAHTHHMNCIAY